MMINNIVLILPAQRKFIEFECNQIDLGNNRSASSVFQNIGITFSVVKVVSSKCSIFGAIRSDL
jgi:hypothetical protein